MTEHDPLCERLAQLAVPEADALRSEHTRSLARTRFLRTPPLESSPLPSLVRWLEPMLLAFVMFVYLSWSVSALAALRRAEPRAVNSAHSGD